jgi:hypothetical protein
MAGIQNGSKKRWRAACWLSHLLGRGQAEAQTPMTKTVPVRVIVQRSLQVAHENRDPIPETPLFKDVESKPTIIVPPPDPSKPSVVESEAGSKVEEDELCEKPLPLQPFHATDLQVALERASACGFLVLWKARERWDLYGRSQTYWAITPSLTLKLLRCEGDCKGEDEFTPEELVVLRDLVLKRWLKTMKNGKTYYCCLSPKTAYFLRKQMGRT